MWSGIDCGERGGERGEGSSIQGARAVNRSIPALINNIKGKTWLKVDEMKSLYNAKPGRRREERRDGRYFFQQAARATGYCTEHAAEETNNRLSSIAD